MKDSPLYEHKVNLTNNGRELTAYVHVEHAPLSGQKLLEGDYKRVLGKVECTDSDTGEKVEVTPQIRGQITAILRKEEELD